jgi:glycosyltransferase involved in cell wall biosynthesis
LLQYIERSGLADRVHIVTNRNDIPDLLALANVFVMPSLIEGLPMALLEAMHARKAIIASVTAGIPEAIVNDREGLLVPPGDVDALSRAIELLLTDPARRLALGDAAAARANSDFTVQIMADRYEALYAGARARRRPRAAGRFLESQVMTAS